MVYYVITKQASTESPARYKKVLNALVELAQESDVPYQPKQVAHAAELKEEEVERGLKWLKKEGYVEEARLPRPEAAARLRIPPIEKLVEAELRRQASQQRYLKSNKGKAALERYWNLGKGIEVRKRYWQSEKGKAAQKRYRQNRRAREIAAFEAKQKEVKT